MVVFRILVVSQLFFCQLEPLISAIIENFLDEMRSAKVGPECNDFETSV
jgi:hypothetical protein